MQVKPFALNGEQGNKLGLYPAYYFFLSNVVLLSMYFLGTMVQHYAEFIDYIVDVDKLIITGLGTLLFWHWFKQHPPKHKDKPKHVKDKENKNNRKLLKLLIMAAA